MAQSPHVAFTTYIDHRGDLGSTAPGIAIGGDFSTPIAGPLHLNISIIHSLADKIESPGASTSIRSDVNIYLTSSWYISPGISFTSITTDAYSKSGTFFTQGFGYNHYDQLLPEIRVHKDLTSPNNSLGLSFGMQSFVPIQNFWGIVLDPEIGVLNFEQPADSGLRQSGTWISMGVGIYWRP